MAALAHVIRRRTPLLSVALLAAAAATLCGLDLSFVSGRGLACRGNLVTRRFKAGDAVEANYGDGNWYSAVVEKKNGDGTFTVKWDDAAGGPPTADCAAENIKAYVPPMRMDELQIGQKYTGKVRSVTGFGAFVNFGAEKDGLVHISCISDGFVANVNDIVSEGQEVTVWVKGVADGKISLTMVESKLGGGGGRGPRKQVDLSQFQSLVMGDKIPGKVVSVTNFGAFVEITSPSGEPAQGLVHVSEMSDDYVSSPADVVSVGQQVDVTVKEVNLATGKMSLTMKSN